MFGRLQARVEKLEALARAELAAGVVPENETAEQRYFRMINTSPPRRCSSSAAPKYSPEQAYQKMIGSAL